MSQPLVIFIHGSTASGKTDLSVGAAQMLGAEIINCDSVQVYASLQIGAAKPTVEQLQSVPHHLIGHVADGVKYTAGEYRRDALSVIEKRFQAGQKLFFVVGGSGFYSQALIKGMFPVPKVKPEERAALHQEFSEKGLSPLYLELCERDPAYAKKVGSNDPYRILRALEILRFTEFKTMFAVHSAFEMQTPPFEFVQMGLRHVRSKLRTRIEERTTKMLETGLVEETRVLLERGLQDWPALHSVGYQEACDLLSGRLPASKIHEQIVQSTMQLAKRQMTWFRRDSRIHWWDSDQDATAPFNYLREVALDSGIRPLDTEMARRAIDEKHDRLRSCNIDIQ